MLLTFSKKTIPKVTYNFLESKFLTVKLKLKILVVRVLKVINNLTLYSMFTLAEENLRVDRYTTKKN